jgi:hypothetical protein
MLLADTRTECYECEWNVSDSVFLESRLSRRAFRRQTLTSFSAITVHCNVETLYLIA